MTKSWLTENNVPFIEKNVENEENRMELMKMGYQATPVSLYGLLSYTNMKFDTMRVFKHMNDIIGTIK